MHSTHILAPSIILLNLVGFHQLKHTAESTDRNATILRRNAGNQFFQLVQEHLKDKNAVNSPFMGEVDGTCCTSPRSATIYRYRYLVQSVVTMIRITTMKNTHSVYSPMQEFLFPTLFLMSDDVIIVFTILPVISPSFSQHAQQVALIQPSMHP